MRELNAVMAALQAEIAAALGAGASLPDGAKLAADRVTVSLAFAVEEPRGSNGTGDVRFVVPIGETPAKGGAPHALTIEFKVSHGRPVPLGSTSASAAEAALPPRVFSESIPEADEARVMKILSGVFGAPGFDSSARGTVFREAFEELDAARAQAVVASLGSQAVPEDPATRRARHLLVRMLQSGPGGLAAGAQALQELFQQYPLAAITRFVETRWKTQAAWMK